MSSNGLVSIICRLELKQFFSEKIIQRIALSSSNVGVSDEMFVVFFVKEIVVMSLGKSSLVVFGSSSAAAKI
ncbi:hypothetical protein SNEBB_000037 [Seison nebaliae]|nr:hypothetical protein SNEBB_000037 [Seison nebaliae]